MNDLYQIFFIIIALIIAIVSLGYALIKFEAAIIIILVSPWVSAFFVPNSILADENTNTGIGSYIRVSMVVAMGIIGIVYYLRSWKSHRGRFSLELLLVGIFGIYALYSTTYSIDSQITLIRAATFLAFYGFLIGLYSWIDEDNIETIMNLLYKFVVLMFILNIAAIFILPGKVWWWTAPNRFQGLLSQPNSFGGFCVVALILVSWKFTKSETTRIKILQIMLIILVVIFLFLTGSRTSIISSLLIISIWFFIQKKFLKLTKILVPALLAIIIILELTPIESTSLHRGGDKGLTDLTGRDEFWTGAITLIKERPWLGYGYGVQGKIWEDPRFNDPKLALWSGSARESLHNGYISVTVSLGIPGLFIYLLFLFLPIYKFLNIKILVLKDAFAITLSVIIVSLIVNFVEGGTGGGRSVGSVFFWISWVISLKILVINTVKNNYLTN